ncbi:MAG: transposase [Vulcanimicrobiota bacterium]
MAKKQKAPKAEYDSAWKRALLKYLPDFFELFFPEIGKHVDWSRKPKFLDRELQRIAPAMGQGGGKRAVDLLVELQWLEGGPMLVLVHIEVQSQKEMGFPKRVFFYYARITETYDKPLCTLVILADKHPNWRPKSYASNFAGHHLLFEFPTLKLLDLKDRLPEFRRSTNPFAHLVAATLYNHLHKPGTKAREDGKYSLVTALHELGLKRKEIVEFYSFIDQILRLSANQEKNFKLKLQKFEKERKMRYITSIERLGLEKGREVERLEVARRMLARGFTKEQIQQATELSEKELTDLEKELEVKEG